MAGWERVLTDVVRDRRADLLAYAALCTTTRGEAELVLREALVRAFSGRRRPRSADDATAAVRAAVRTVCAVRADAPSTGTARVVAARSARPARATATDNARATATDNARATATVTARDTARVLVDTRAALAALATMQRLCVVAHHVDDLPVGRIAEDLRTSEAAVRRELAAGTAELRRLVGASMERAVQEMRDTASIPSVPSQGRAS